MVFVPPLVLGTFMQNFTIEKINVAWQYLLGGFAVGAISIPAAIFPDIFMEYLIFVLPLPAFFSSAVTTLGNCMSPIAMLLTGMTIAKIDLKSTFTNLSIYAVSLLRLLAYPLVFILLCMVLKLPHGLAVCTVCSVAMPLGLNTIIVPNAYGRDTSVAAGMSLISHLLSCISISLVFMLFDLLVA